MRLLYIANIRLPTEKAHGAQIVKMCEAFANLGAEVTLAVPARFTSIRQDVYEYYGVERNFRIKRLPVIDTVFLGAPGFWLESCTFAVSALFFALNEKADIVYGRDEGVLWFLQTLGVRGIAWETHTGAWNIFARSVVTRTNHLIAISQGLKTFYENHGVSATKVCVAHDGVDLRAFAHVETKTASRTRLGLPHDAKLAFYVGRLDGWKGTDTLFAASEHIPEDATLAVIGGEPRQLASLSKRYPHIRFLGSRPYRELADNLASADVLVLPNTGSDPVSVSFTSPLKLFAYMASNRPIVASDLPSIREVLTNDMAYLVPADNPEALAAGIMKALSNLGADVRAVEARHAVDRYTWEARAKSILAFLAA